MLKRKASFQAIAPSSVMKLTRNGNEEDLRGKITIAEDQVEPLLKTAKLLRVTGLATSESANTHPRKQRLHSSRKEPPASKIQYCGQPSELLFKRESTCYQHF